MSQLKNEKINLLMDLLKKLAKKSIKIVGNVILTIFGLGCALVAVGSISLKEFAVGILFGVISLFFLIHPIKCVKQGQSKMLIFIYNTVLIFCGLFCLLGSFVEPAFLVVTIICMILLIEQNSIVIKQLKIDRLNKKLTKQIEECKEDEENNYLLNNMIQYNNSFFKFAGNILSENNSVYVKLNDNNFPKFDIDSIVTIIFEDVTNSSWPFLEVFSYTYFENLINKYIKRTPSFKYLKKKVIGLLEMINGRGNRSAILDLFDDNMHSFFMKVDDVIKVKLYNNCIANYDTEKNRYGVETEKEGNYFEKELVKYYFYFMDSIVSSACIAYLMSFSAKINSIKEKNDEFYTIIDNMLKETTDLELIYKKGYELLKNLYSVDYSYIEDIDSFKIFIDMINSLDFISKDDRIKNYLNKFGSLKPEAFLEKAAVDQFYMNDEELKNIISYLIKSLSIDSIKSLFDQLAQIDIYINNYKAAYRTEKLSNERDQYLKGNFSNLKEEEANKQSLENIHTGIEFEKYLVKLFKDMGYEAKHTGKAGDQGCDLLVRKNNKTYCVQAKYYTSALDNTPVQEIIGSLRHYKGDRGVVITNSVFTSGAYQLAKSNDVILINGNKLRKLINYLYSDNDVNRDILDDIDYL